MSSSPESSSAARSFASDTPATAVVDLVGLHRRLRAQLRWLLPIGAALLLLLIYQLATLPKRAALTGYRYQQVGVQPDSTWWILAYRDGKAEILFSRDTARGWQRHALGLDSSQARALALNWGGKALLVGDGGAVRMYDAQFQLLDSVQHPFGRQLDAHWVAVNKDGQRAVVIGDSGQMQRTVNGGTSWMRTGSPTYWRKRAAFGDADEWLFASRHDYQAFNASFLVTGGDKGILNRSGAWSSADTVSPPIYFGLNAQGLPRMLRQNGSAEYGSRHYTAADVTGQFPVGAKPRDAAFSPGRPGFCLIISPTQVFAGQLGGPFTNLQPEADDTSRVAPKASAKNTADSSKNKPSAPAASGSKTPAKTPAVRPTKAPKNAGVTKAKKSVTTPKNPAKQQAQKADASAGDVARPDTTGAAAIRAKIRAANAKKEAKSPPYQQTKESPVQQNQINPANQALPPQNQSTPSKEKN